MTTTGIKTCRSQQHTHTMPRMLHSIVWEQRAQLPPSRCCSSAVKPTLKSVLKSLPPTMPTDASRLCAFCTLAASQAAHAILPGASRHGWPNESGTAENHGFDCLEKYERVNDKRLLLCAARVQPESEMVDPQLMYGDSNARSREAGQPSDYTRIPRSISSTRPVVEADRLWAGSIGATGCSNLSEATRLCDVPE